MSLVEESVYVHGLRVSREVKNYSGSFAFQMHYHTALTQTRQYILSAARLLTLAEFNMFHWLTTGTQDSLSSAGGFIIKY
jgi:hypothetical protein